MRKTSLLLLHSPYECFDPPEDANALAILHYKFEAAAEDERNHRCVRGRPASSFAGVVISPVRIHRNRYKERWSTHPGGKAKHFSAIPCQYWSVSVRADGINHLNPNSFSAFSAPSIPRISFSRAK
jgi:hypothetical protein